ncbi:MAG: hypothetical protein E6G44_06965 [Actinobacteria bacterium]|nr:MAG: hypothetical protein E6G44_06965 [Actinomycetota bacterium]
MLRGVRYVVVDPARAGTVYVSEFDAYTGGFGIYRSTDGGASGASFNQGLSNLRVSSLAVDQAGRGLHAGTFSSGVWDRSLP